VQHEGKKLRDYLYTNRIEVVDLAKRLGKDRSVLYYNFGRQKLSEEIKQLLKHNKIDWNSMSYQENDHSEQFNEPSAIYDGKKTIKNQANPITTNQNSTEAFINLTRSNLIAAEALKRQAEAAHIQATAAQIQAEALKIQVLNESDLIAVLKTIVSRGGPIPEVGKLLKKPFDKKFGKSKVSHHN
jgi:hypothetical protein